MVFSACVPVTRVHQIQPCRAKADPACRGCLAAKGAGTRAATWTAVRTSSTATAGTEWVGACPPGQVSGRASFARRVAPLSCRPPAAPSSRQTHFARSCTWHQSIRKRSVLETRNSARRGADGCECVASDGHAHPRTLNKAGRHSESRSKLDFDVCPRLNEWWANLPTTQRVVSKFFWARFCSVERVGRPCLRPARMIGDVHCVFSPAKRRVTGRRLRVLAHETSHDCAAMAPR